MAKALRVRVKDIEKAIRAGLTPTEISRRFPVSRSYVYVLKQQMQLAGESNPEQAA